MIIAGFAIILLFVWIPFDTDTGLIEKVRRRTTIGDALAPSLAGLFLLLGGVSLVLFERKSPHQPRLGASSIGFMAAMLLLLAIGLLLMRYTGPSLVALANVLLDRSMEYRLLRDSIPWKYTGYLVGGTFLLAAMISLVEGRLSRRAVIVAVMAVIVLIAIYDLPFDDLLLPPNGDV